MPRHALKRAQRSLPVCQNLTLTGSSLKRPLTTSAKICAAEATATSESRNSDLVKTLYEIEGKNNDANGLIRKIPGEPERRKSLKMLKKTLREDFEEMMRLQKERTRATSKTSTIIRQGSLLLDKSRKRASRDRFARSAAASKSRITHPDKRMHDAPSKSSGSSNQYALLQGSDEPYGWKFDSFTIGLANTKDSARGLQIAGRNRKVLSDPQYSGAQSIKEDEGGRTEEGVYKV